MKTKRSYTHPPTPTKKNMELNNISQIKRLMKQSCEEFHSVELLCEQIGVTYHTFRKEFRRNEGFSISEFLQRCRLQKAEELLSHKGNCIYQVAIKIGFSSDGNFTRWLKKRRGMTPTEFQNQVRQNQD